MHTETVKTLAGNKISIYFIYSILSKLSFINGMSISAFMFRDAVCQMSFAFFCNEGSWINHHTEKKFEFIVCSDDNYHRILICRCINNWKINHLGWLQLPSIVNVTYNVDILDHFFPFWYGRRSIRDLDVGWNGDEAPTTFSNELISFNIIEFITN